jgi:hypothetical protein
VLSLSIVIAVTVSITLFSFLERIEQIRDELIIRRNRSENLGRQVRKPRMTGSNMDKTQQTGHRKDYSKRFKDMES